MNCNHTRATSRWVVETEDWYSGEMVGRWQYSSENTYVDIDLHRYKCTQCNEIFYYSDRARQYFEEGVKFD